MPAQELAVLPQPPVPTPGENRGGRTREPLLLPLQDSLLLGGLAEAALEDGECPGPPAWPPTPTEAVRGGARREQPCPAGTLLPFAPAVESLRHLVLWSLLPGRPLESQAAGEPEDDLTPTPAALGMTSHPWDPGSPGPDPSRGKGDTSQLPDQEQEAAQVGCSLAHLPPRTRHSGVWESPELDRKSEEEATGSYKVVRKGKLRPCALGRQCHANSTCRGGPGHWDSKGHWH